MVLTCNEENSEESTSSIILFWLSIFLNALQLLFFGVSIVSIPFFNCIYTKIMFVKIEETSPGDLNDFETPQTKDNNSKIDEELDSNFL